MTADPSMAELTAQITDLLVELTELEDHHYDDDPAYMRRDLDLRDRIKRLKDQRDLLPMQREP